MIDINEIQEKIIGIVNDVMKNAKVELNQVDVDLSIYGMDSITFMHVIVAIEETFGIEIPDDFLLANEMNTIEKMTNVVLFEMANDSI